MAGSPSRFVWYELMTPDPAAAQAFYAAVVGWGAQDASQPGKPYRLLTVGGAPIGGLMGLPRPGAPPCWTGWPRTPDLTRGTDSFRGFLRVLGKIQHFAQNGRRSPPAAAGGGLSREGRIPPPFVRMGGPDATGLRS